MKTPSAAPISSWISALALAMAGAISSRKASHNKCGHAEILTGRYLSGELKIPFPIRAASLTAKYSNPWRHRHTT